MEKRIVDLDIAIRSALHHEEPDMTRSISLISELQQLAIQPLMLKKIPNIVMTLRKVRKYIGPVTPHPDPQVCTDISTTYLALIGMSYERKRSAQFWLHLGHLLLDSMSLSGFQINPIDVNFHQKVWGILVKIQLTV